MSVNCFYQLSFYGIKHIYSSTNESEKWESSSQRAADALRGRRVRQAAKMRPAVSLYRWYKLQNTALWRLLVLPMCIAVLIYKILCNTNLNCSCNNECSRLKVVSQSYFLMEKIILKLYNLLVFGTAFLKRFICWAVRYASVILLKLNYN